MLFYKKTVSYQPRIPPKGYSDAIPERFVPDRNLVYIKKGKMPTMKILTRKDLASVFSDNERALEFIKKNKVKHDDIEALHRLVSFINKN